MPGQLWSQGVMKPGCMLGAIVRMRQDKGQQDAAGLMGRGKVTGDTVDNTGRQL